MKEDKSKLIDVFRGTVWEADLLKSMLNDNDIDAVTKDSMVVNLALPATAVEVSVLVNESQYEPAMEVVRQYEENRGNA
ncbi:MAG: DUF2007 domain-containing protein [Bacteroides sp.]|nr:DUF2007 domain-containing protein [Bacteroides sp.]